MNIGTLPFGTGQSRLTFQSLRRSCSLLSTLKIAFFTRWGQGDLGVTTLDHGPCLSFAQ